VSLSALERKRQRVIMFGGKGGVGKTTTSATTALHFARSGRQTLIVSSDLSPSLSDIFETQIGACERSVPGVPGLYGLEINPDEVMRRWKTKFGPEVYNAASNLVDIPYDDLVDYAAMAPGIQEEFMLDYILERVRVGQFGIQVSQLVINHVITDPDSAFLRAKQEMQTPYIQQLQAEYGQRVTIVQVPEFPHEIKGVDKLQIVEKALFDR
jgi:anion-transporting  ArsA/GET3 family ATPase